MKYTTELKANIKVGRGKSISASVGGEMEKVDDIQIGTMRNMLQHMVNGFISKPVEINTAIKPQTNKKMISDKQLGLLRYLLKSTQVSECDLCRKYSVRQLDELTMADARIAIQDLKLSMDFEEQ